jgi:hypothetical protein
MTDTPPTPPDDAAAKAAADKAAADAAAAGSTPAATQAAASTAASTAAPGLTDAEIERIATRSADIQVEKFKALGAFDHPEPTPAATLATPAADADPGTPPAEEQPKKRSLADKFLGVNK